MSTEFTQQIKLPSQGFLNPEIPGGILTQRCMMVTDQKFLNGTNQSANSSLHELLNRTTTQPEGFDVSRLTATDTLYMLFKLRILSYGEDYKFITRCPECGKKIEVSIKLSDLPVTTLEEDYAEKLSGKLPHRGDTVYTRILTNQDSEEIDREIKRRKKRNPEDESGYILRIARGIEKIELVEPDKNGKKELTGSLDIERYVGNLTDLDARAIMSIRDSINYGIDTLIEQICPECGEYIDINVRFSSEFFRPTISR